MSTGEAPPTSGAYSEEVDIPPEVPPMPEAEPPTQQYLGGGPEPQSYLAGGTAGSGGGAGPEAVPQAGAAGLASVPAAAATSTAGVGGGVNHLLGNSSAISQASNIKWVWLLFIYLFI